MGLIKSSFRRGKKKIDSLLDKPKKYFPEKELFKIIKGRPHLAKKIRGMVLKKLKTKQWVNLNKVGILQEIDAMANAPSNTKINNKIKELKKQKKVKIN